MKTAISFITHPNTGRRRKKTARVRNRIGFHTAIVASAPATAEIETETKDYARYISTLDTLLLASLNESVNRFDTEGCDWDHITVAQQNFLTGATLILMADGTMKRADELQIGDRVLSVPHGSPGGTPVPCAITEIEAGVAQSAWQLTFINGDNETLELSLAGGHPLWVEGKGWTDVANLELGDICVTADGVVFTLQEKILIESSILTYSITVEDNHTFFVGDENGNVILAHNAKGKIVAWAVKAGKRILKVKPLYTNKEAAKLLIQKNILGEATINILVRNGKDQAMKIAKMVQSQMPKTKAGKILTHQGHPDAAKNLLGQITGDGLRHVQLDKAAGHIFYSSLAVVLTAIASNNANATEGISVEIEEVYDVPNASNWVAGASVSHWTGQEGVLGWTGFVVDIANPFELLAVAGDIVRDGYQSWNKDLKAYVITIVDEEGNVHTIVLDPEGKLVQ